MSNSSSNVEVLLRGLQLTALFMFVFAALLFLSWALLLPKFTAISLEGQQYSVTSLADLQSNLQASITDLQFRRKAVLKPVNNDQFSTLKKEQQELPSLSTIRVHVKEALNSLQRENKPLALIHSIEYRGSTKQVGIRGQILDTSAQSMTIFAQVVAVLEQLAFVEQIDRSRLHRGGKATSFDIVLHL